MIFTLPSLSRYSIGLVIIAAFSFALYFIHDTSNLASIHPLTIAISGLVIGHFIGSVIKPVTANPLQNAASSTTPRDAAEATGHKQTLYVGNIAYNASRGDLERLFSRYGRVHSTRIMMDKQTRKSRGYGFIEMDSKSARQAVNQLNGFEFKGRSLRVNEANDRD